MGSPWKALSEDNRRQILLLLGKRDTTPTEIAKHLNSSLPLVSTQLRILKDADLITEKKQGKNRLYSLNRDKTLELVSIALLLWAYYSISSRLTRSCNIVYDKSDPDD